MSAGYSFLLYRRAVIADFRRLGYFLQVAELGSLIRTADRLGIAQPSLSRQMRLLEEELGVTLFTRGHRGMQLTEAGEALHARIAGPLRQVGHALYEIRSLPSDPQGSVTFGMPPSVASLLGAPLLRRIACQSPGIKVYVVEALSGHLLGMMKRGELDAAILYGPTPAGLNAARLLDEELVLLSMADRDLSAEIDFKDVAELPLVLPQDVHGLRIAVQAAAARTRTALRIEIEADSLSVIQALVASGEVCSIVPRAWASALVVLGGFRASAIKKPTLVRQLFAAMQSQAEWPRAVLKVEELARQELAALTAGGAWPGAQILDVGDS